MTAILITFSMEKALALTADDVLNKMSTEQRHAYIAGMVEGFAYSRWLRDKPEGAGMSCIYDWYYQGGSERKRGIDQWFGRHPDKPAGPLLYVLLQPECGG